MTTLEKSSTGSDTVDMHWIQVDLNRYFSDRDYKMKSLVKTQTFQSDIANKSEMKIR